VVRKLKKSGEGRKHTPEGKRNESRIYWYIEVSNVDARVDILGRGETHQKGINKPFQGHTGKKARFTRVMALLHVTTNGLQRMHI